MATWMAFGKYLESMPWSLPIRESFWLYPFIQLIHFTGLSIWLGTNLLVDLRLLGVGKRQETATELNHDLFAWNWIGFAIVVTGGFLLFSPVATTYIVNRAFQVKLTMLVPTALIWHIIVQQKTGSWGRSPETPAVAKFAGLLEILLWLSVVVAAVNIPNY
jgi:hypothetical protein